jgi:glycosyltransferase involved in cell wall biosynthesis
MTPDVAAIIPTHNRSHLLATTLRTVLWQREVSLEVIVVDDGSSDDTATAVAELRDPRLRLIRHHAPQGVSAARNRGAAEADASWLAFCDDDDLWAPDKLVRQLAAAHALNRTWAYGGAVHVSIDLRVLSAKPPPPPERLIAVLPAWNLMPGGSSNVIVRADTFQAAGGWDRSLVNLADWDLWARLAREGPPAYVVAPLVGYRIHAGNASADVGLILREARVLDGRYGARLDYGELHHYLAWVYLRAGHRRPAVAHLIRASARGQARSVARAVTSLASRRLARGLPILGPRQDAADLAWIGEADTWVARLREPDLATT